MTENPAPLQFDPRSLPAAFYVDPYPTYARLRAEAPVWRCPDGSWFLTRHADCLSVYRDTRRFSSDKRTQFAPVFGTDSPLYEHHTTSLVFNDPPLHTRVRRAMGDALSPRSVQRLVPVVEQLVGDLLRRLESRLRSSDATVDLISDYASAIPVEVISNLIGVPREVREPLRDWSLAILGALEFGLDDAGRERGNQAVRDFLGFLSALAAERRRTLNPDDDDLMARLLRVEGMSDGLTARELLHQCIFLLNAGHETTTNLIGNGAGLLVERPDVVAAMVRDPSLIDSIVEEVLRMESPNQLGNRTTTETVEIGGVNIPAGSVLTLCIGAANRDPAVFDSPDDFRVNRPENPHLAFGSGVHTCAGLAVARLEGKIALLRLFERFPGLRVARSLRAERARFRGYASLDARSA